MLTKFLDPKNDVAFKKIFGTEKNKDILIHFLNDVLVFKGNLPIQDVSFLTTTQEPETAAMKTSIVDILCKDERGSSYIVEMQVAKTKGFEKRAQYYAAKAYSTQIMKGDDYPDLKEVIFLAVADCLIFPEKGGYKSDHVILDQKSGEHDLKDFSFTFIELPKFKKTIDELVNIQEKWCYFFKHAGETSSEDLQKLIGRDVVIQRAYEELDRFSWSGHELTWYEQVEKRARDYVSSMAQKLDEGIAQGRAEGKAEGRAEGKAEGRAEGKAEGRAEGKAEGRAEGRIEEKIEGIKRRLRRDHLIEEIAEDTGLTVQEIEKIKLDLCVTNTSS